MIPEHDEVDRTGRLRGTRVVFVLPSLALGGAERQAFLLGRHLASREGAEVRMVAFARRGGTADLCELAGIPCDLFDLWHTGRGRYAQAVDLCRFALFLRRLRVDVVLPYCMFQNVICALTWRAAGARVCIWNQRDEGRSRARLDPWVERFAVKRVTCFVSNSAHGEGFLTEELGIAPERVHVIYNGVELSQPLASRAEWRSNLGVSDDAFVACMVANLHGHKDHATLVSAWRYVVDRLRQEGKHAHLVLAGVAGDRHESIAHQVQGLCLGEYVHLIGETRDVPGLLSAVDIAVFSSHAEGVPNAVLEAMAAGLAVVATDYPGIREAVGTSGEPLLARRGDPADLGVKIVTVAGDRELRARVGADGKSRVASEFAVERMCHEMVGRILAELV